MIWPVARIFFFPRRDMALRHAHDVNDTAGTVFIVIDSVLLIVRYVCCAHLVIAYLRILTAFICTLSYATPALRPDDTA